MTHVDKQSDGANAVKLFSYGTLQEPEIQRMLLGRELTMRRAELAGVKLTVAYGGMYPALVEGDEKVPGSVLEIYEEELPRLDRYEGPAYVRTVKETVDGEQVFVYMLEEEL